MSAIITLARMSREEKTAISVGTSGQGGWGDLSASAESLFQAELAKAVKSGRADIQVVATGGTGFGSLGETIKALASHPDSLPAIQSALGLYLVQFTAENSVPIGFHVESMESFGWRTASEDLWTKLAVGQRLLTMRPDRSKIESEYLAFFLRTPEFSRKMLENSSGSTVRGIKSRLLKKIDICYPALEHQKRFSAALRTVSAMNEQARALHIEGNALFASLQSRAFSGQL